MTINKHDKQIIESIKIAIVVIPIVVILVLLYGAITSNFTTDPLLFLYKNTEIAKNYKAKDCLPENAKWSVKYLTKKKRIIKAEFIWDSEEALLKIVKSSLFKSTAGIYWKNKFGEWSEIPDVDLGDFCEIVKSRKDTQRKIQILNSVD